MKNNSIFYKHLVLHAKNDEIFKLLSKNIIF